MKKANFDRFLQAVASVPENGDLWWAGYLFLDLNSKQMEKTYEVAKNRFGEKLNERMKRTEVVLPSGLALTKRA